MIKRIKSFLFENKTVRQTVAKNTFWLGVTSFGNRAIKAFVIIYAARILGAEKYGIFSYALTIAATFSIFSDLGVSSVITREASRSKDQPETLKRYLTNSYAIKFTLIAVNALLIVFIAPLFTTIKAALALLPLAALLTTFDGLRESTFYLTRANEKMETESFVSIITGVATTILGLGVLFLHPGPYALIVAYAAASGIGFIISVPLLGPYLKNFFKSLDKKITTEIIREALPFGLMGLLGALTLNTDALMISWLRSARDLGLYSAVQRPIALIYLIPSLLTASLFPLFARTAKKDDEQMRSLVERGIAGLLLVGIPIVVGGIILSSQITFLLFGAEYLPVASTFAALLLTLLVLFPSGMIMSAFFAYNEQKKILWCFLIGAATNAIFDYIFIRPYGIIGSAYATILSQSLAYGIAWIWLKRMNDVRVLHRMPKIVVSAVLMGGLSIVLKRIGVSVIPNIIVSGGFYFGTLYLLKENLLTEFVPFLRPKPEPII